MLAVQGNLQAFRCHLFKDALFIIEYNKSI